MSNFTISVFSNKIFFQIIKEIKLFSKFRIKHYEDIDLCMQDAEKGNQVVVFFDNSLNKSKTNNFPSIIVAESYKLINKSSGILQEQLNMPFSILDFKKKNYYTYR